MRNLLTAHRAAVAAVATLQPVEAAELLRGLADELDPGTISTHSGRVSAWCNVCGPCACLNRDEGSLDNPECPIHGVSSTHVPGVTHL